jgi:uncharacterized lipoprotein YbaY
MNHYHPMPRRGIALLAMLLAWGGQPNSGHGQYPVPSTVTAPPAGTWTTAYSTAPNSWGSPAGGLGTTGTAKKWRLGVDGTNTDVGVMVNQVTANSPAARSAIKPRDMIVTVAGDQVGRVGGKVFELSEELNHHADSRGLIELLVQDSQTMQLRTVRVQLEDQPAGLSGVLTVTEGTLPTDAVVTVKLENITRPHYVVRNGEYSFRPPIYSGGRIPFTLNYDPAYVLATDTYRVRAQITSGGRTIFDTRQPQLVLTQGNPNTVTLALTPAAYINVSGSNNGTVLTAGYVNYDAISQRVTADYERYLGRPPSAMELAAWHQVPDIELRLQRLPLELMASQEYFDMVGNNNVVWIRKVFGEVIGRTPTALELDQWMRRFADVRYSRMEVLNQMKSISGG